jgi:hypothetical protein
VENSLLEGKEGKNARLLLEPVVMKWTRIVKIFELAFLLEVTPPTIAALHLVFRPPVTDTHRQYGR